MDTTERRADEIESKVRELAVAAGLDPAQLGMLLHVELEQFSNYPITVHLLGDEWIPAAIKNEAGIVGSTVGISKPMESFSRLQEFEGTMLGMLGTILPAHRMQEIEQAVARGARVSVFHFRKKLRGQDGIWGITIVWEKDSAEK
jgi:hypothetical protein